MSIVRGLPLLLVALLAASPLGAQRARERRCLLEFERPVGREGVQVTPFPGNVNYYAGGDVRLRCQGQNVRLGADSLESINGDVIRLVTKAYYRDADLSIRADTLTYYKVGERLEARGSVVVVNTRDASTLRGPHLDYLRGVRGVRDSAETIAMQRPTVTLVPKRAKGDTAKASPYLIVADLLRGFGSSRFSGRGGVTVDRDELAGRGDSLLYTTGTAGRTLLTGAPATWRRIGADSFTVKGSQIVLGLTDEVLDELRAYGDGDVLQDSTRITGDSVALRFTDGKLVRTDAWGRGTQAHATRDGYDIVGDSVVILTPGEQLEAIRVFGNGMIRNPEDSTRAAAPADSTAPPPERDTLWGTTLDARFAQVDSAGTVITRLLRLEATGLARSLMTQSVQRNGRTTPTINYSLADTIVIVMKPHPANGFEEVRMRGNVQGLQLETATLGKRVALPAGRGTP